MRRTFRSIVRADRLKLSALNRISASESRVFTRGALAIASPNVAPYADEPGPAKPKKLDFTIWPKGKRDHVRIILELTRSDNDVLKGTVQWSGAEPLHQFHGTLELLAILETASAQATTLDPAEDTKW